MNIKGSGLLIFYLMCLFPAVAAAQQSSLIERNIGLGENSFDEGRFSAAEKAFHRAQVCLEKEGERNERLVAVFSRLADCYLKERKYFEAEAAYRTALEISRERSLEQSVLLERLKVLSDFYRSIDLSDPAEDSPLKQAGALRAAVLNENGRHHIDISLKQSFKRVIHDKSDTRDSHATADQLDDLYEDDSSAVAAGSASSRALKQIRFDKKLSFDLLPESAEGKLRIENIQGVSFDVGLWVMLKEFAFLPVDNGEASVELRAGAFGAEKTVKVALSENLYSRLKGALDKIDPFSLAELRPARAAETPCINEKTPLSD